MTNNREAEDNGRAGTRLEGAPSARYVCRVPKECAHWIIARRVAAAYPGPRVRALLDRWQSLYLLGSVLPDSAFYNLVGRHRAELLALAEVLHGSRGGDPLFFLDRATTEPLAALALGVACHIMVDSQFHPIVCWFCGIEELHGGALERHFAFEGWLDAHYSSLEAPAGRGRLARILRQSPMKLPRIAALVQALLYDESVPRRAVASALRQHARLQRLFYSGALRCAVAAVKRLFPRAGAPYAALLTPSARGPVPFFEEPFAYTHPSTGQERTEALADVEARVARLMRRVFDFFEKDADARTDAISLPRLSAETGVAPSATPRTRLMRFFQVCDVEALLRGADLGRRAALTRR